MASRPQYGRSSRVTQTMRWCGLTAPVVAGFVPLAAPPRDV
jgi:hypothetical protein